MPPKKRISFNRRNHNAIKRTKKSDTCEGIFEVAKVVSCRLDPEDSDVSLQFLISWLNFGPENNSWEPLESLRLNTVFIDFINKKFKEFEADIFVQIANIKMMQRMKRIKTLEEFKKVAIMQQIYPFCPFEFKVHQVVQHLLPNPPVKYIKNLEDLVFRSYFFKLEEVQRIKLDSLAKTMMEQEGIKVTIENDIDFEVPPEFTYINKNICSEEVLIAMNHDTSQMELESSEIKIEGCQCGRNQCSYQSKCCPQMLELPFAYKETKNERKVRLNRQEPIIECTDKCKCDENCLNRVTQQKRNLSLCLFNTETRGWGVKTMEPIKKGIYITEYTGELLGCGVAAKQEVTSYLFDLNMDRLSHGFYTIDAHKFGNLARFVNHSCDPNSSMWVVSDCTKNPRNQKLCIFSLRDIGKDEEITIDYSPIETVPTTDRMNGSRSFYAECFCGSEACRAKKNLHKKR